MEAERVRAQLDRILAGAAFAAAAAMKSRNPSSASSCWDERPLVLIDLPKGGYVPRFQQRTLPESVRVPAGKGAHLGLIAGAALLGSLAFWTVWAHGK